jgi:high-affinity nickel-transport protein
MVCLLILSAARLGLHDTLNGSYLNFVYPWFFSRPLCRLGDDMAVTSMSLLIAAIVGYVELLDLLTGRSIFTRSSWEGLGDTGFNQVGCVVVGALAATWGAALLKWWIARHP